MALLKPYDFERERFRHSEDEELKGNENNERSRVHVTFWCTYEVVFYFCIERHWTSPEISVHFIWAALTVTVITILEYRSISATVAANTHC